MGLRHTFAVNLSDFDANFFMGSLTSRDPGNQRVSKHFEFWLSYSKISKWRFGKQSNLCKVRRQVKNDVTELTMGDLEST